MNIETARTSLLNSLGRSMQDVYRPQTKFAKVMFLHLSVSHSVHRGRAWMRGGMHGSRGCAWLQGGHVWLQGGVCGIRRDTVNERAVRILLECILVLLNNMSVCENTCKC